MPKVLNPLDGTPISYDVTGEGPAVVLLHGSALSRAIWRGLGYVKALAADFSVIRVDLRGHGISGKPHDADAYRMPLVTGDVLAVMDDAGAAAAHVVGYSFGGRVGFALAAAAPGRISTLSTLGGTYLGQAGQIEKVFFPGYLEALRSEGMGGFIDGLTRAGREPDPATRAAFLANDPKALLAYFEETERAPGLSGTALRDLSLPALLMAGSLDRQRLEESRHAASVMPHATCVELPGRTHGTTLFPPGAVLDHLVPFLRDGGTAA